MEQSLQKLSLELNVSDLLRDGSSITQLQLETLQKECRDQETHSQYLKLLQLCPGNVLNSLYCHGQPANALVLSLVDSESCATAVLEASKSKLELLTPLEELRFYLNLSLSVCLKYTQLTNFIFIKLLKLLATEDKSIHGIAVLILILYSKQSTSEASDLVVKYIESVFELNAENISNNAYLLIFSIFETFFPIFPAQMKAIYTSNDCKITMLAKVSKLLLEGDDSDVKMAEQILKAVSLSCIDEDARKFNMDNYLDLFIAGTAVLGPMTIVALSLLCLIKLWNFTVIEKKISLQTVLEKVQNTFRICESDSECVSYILEALSYLSLGVTVKQSLRDDEEFCEKLLLILETEKESSIIYGALVVFLNLSELKEKDGNADTATVNYLKSISLPNKNETRDDDAAVKLFNEALVQNHKLVGTLKGLDLKKEAIGTQAIQILYNLSASGERNIERDIVAQGGLTILLKYLIEHSTIKKGSEKTQALSASEDVLGIRLRALRALAVICRSVNPKLLISEFDIKTVVPFLVEMLGPAVADYSTLLRPSADDPVAALANNLTSLDKLCGLLGLTNLSAMQEKDLISVITRRSFDSHLKDLMIDSTIPDIQKATWELINNLISDPQMLAKFFNTENPESLKNLDVLVKLLHSRDAKLQVVIAGLLANATMEYGLVSLAIMSDEAKVFDRLLEIISSILQKQVSDDDLVLRVCIFLLNIVQAAKSQNLSTLDRIQSSQPLKAGIKAVVLTTKDQDIMLTIREIIGVAELRF